METYKLGNKINCVVRAYAPTTIGDTVLEYANEPFTVLKGVSARINFTDNDREAASAYSRILNYNVDMVDSVEISDVELTNKIMDLIFIKSSTKLINKVENYDSDENNLIFINCSAPEIKDVFIYDNGGALEAHYDSLNIAEALQVKKADSNYLIIYGYDSQVAYDLDRFNNIYLTLDMEVIGNVNDETSKMWLHFDKCGLTVDKNIYFSQKSNTVDLTFKVMIDNSTENYIIVK